MFFEMRFDLGTLDSGERSLPFGLLVADNEKCYLHQVNDGKSPRSATIKDCNPPLAQREE